MSFHCPICGKKESLTRHHCDPETLKRIEAARKGSEVRGQRPIDDGKTYDDKLKDAELLFGD